MAATYLLSKTLIPKLHIDFPDIIFQTDDIFKWSPDLKTIHYDNTLHTKEGAWLLLHELGHALEGHTHYKRDIHLIEMESDAWKAAASLSARYEVSIDPDYIEECMDTYRDWLHERSVCPTCLYSGLQIQKSTYRCFNCGCSWRVNEAKVCSLRRYAIST